MKNMFLIAILALTSSAFASDMAFTEILLKKDSKNVDEIVYVATHSMDVWCKGYGSQIEVGSFEVAQNLDTLADGLYRCTGKFAQVPGPRSNPIHVFELDGCSAANANDLKLECSKK